MKNFAFKLVLFLVLFATGLFVATGEMAFLGLAVFALFMPTDFSFVKSNNLYASELLKRIFIADIQKSLYKDGTFFNRAKNDDQYVATNTVELPHSGAKPATEINRSGAGTIAARTDASTNYAVDEITTDPVTVKVSEEMRVAYNKRADVIEQHIETIKERAGDRALYAWAAGLTVGNQHLIKTTGSTRTPGGPATLTGTGKALTKADFISAKRIFDVDNIPQNGRCVSITAAMYADILGISEFTDAEKFGTPGLPSGVVSKILGFDVYVRSESVMYNNSDALKAEGAVVAVTDRQASLFWQEQQVRRAFGGMNVFINEGVAELYGDVFSAMVMFGGAPSRNDIKGVVALVEDDV
jgi:hypothetical protein